MEPSREQPRRREIERIESRILYLRARTRNADSAEKVYKDGVRLLRAASEIAETGIRRLTQLASDMNEYQTNQEELFKLNRLLREMRRHRLNKSIAERYIILADRGETEWSDHDS
jgi:hypothetical protein